MRIVVVGGSGLVGAELARSLRGQGHAVVAASRASGIDVVMGKGLAEALADIAGCHPGSKHGRLRCFTSGGTSR